MSAHRPRWAALAQLGDVTVEQCAHVRVAPTGTDEADPHDVARAVFIVGLARAWPELARTPDRVEALADVALDAVAASLPGGPR
ncbi:hypothetical protein AB0O28_19050 [Microbispora sp. NPDC088329]|uniref:hypothetical protein n=1 Tax=Microbispora sp. NPDC088329 TaxID=3154869 RepID=UPI0034326BD7